MKRIIKGISLFVIFVFSLVFAHPLNTYALMEQTSYININSTQSLEVGSLSFSDISFKDFSLKLSQEEYSITKFSLPLERKECSFFESKSSLLINSNLKDIISLAIFASW